MPDPDVALLVSTFQKPRHLQLTLSSINLQKGVDGRFEVVVTDDGSIDDTRAVVEDFARLSDFPVGYTTHDHDGFQLSRCRNEGVRASSAPYLLFLDGDCLLADDHVRIHLEHRRVGVANGSDCLRLPPKVSERLDEAAVINGRFAARAPFKEKLRVLREHLDGELNWLLRHPHKPKLFGNNTALWRRDFEQVNGFNERFRHWGGEDDDLRARLVEAGLEIRSLRHRTRTYHLWHPPEPSARSRWSDGRNVPYLTRGFRLTRCMRGLEPRRPEDLRIRIRNGQLFPERVANWFSSWSNTGGDIGSPEVELVFLPGPEVFSGDAEVNVLILMDEVSNPPLDTAHVVVADGLNGAFPPHLTIPHDEFPRLWQILE